MGRKPKLTDLLRGVARERVAKSESARSIAKEWGIAHTTVARAAAQTSGTAGGQPRLARCSWRTLTRCEPSSLAIVLRPA